MRAVVQRVTSAQVEVEGARIGKIGPGLLVFLGVGKEDGETDEAYLREKILGLRIFEDEKGKMNLDIRQTGGAVLVISQFTLFGDCRKGKRPSFDGACEPKWAEALYEKFLQGCRNAGVETQAGSFGADMQVSLVNDGPVTILLDSTKLF